MRKDGLENQLICSLVIGPPESHRLGRASIKESVGKGFSRRCLIVCLLKWVETCRVTIGLGHSWPRARAGGSVQSRGVEPELCPGSWQNLITCFLLEPEVGTWSWKLSGQRRIPLQASKKSIVSQTFKCLWEVVTPMVKKIPFREGAFDDCHPALSSDTVRGQLSSVSHAWTFSLVTASTEAPSCWKSIWDY